MVQQAFKNVEISAEGKEDCFIFHVKVPHPIHKMYAERLADEFEKCVKDFVRVIEQKEFWE